jgi:sterol desaturase/sphingolipid hydroxylase (fatty acid hydroxylase superfamily)
MDFESSMLPMGRVALALAGLSLAMAWERARPVRRARRGRPGAEHELANLGLWCLNAALLQLLAAGAAVAGAAWVTGTQSGLLYRLSSPLWLNVVVTVLVLDAVTYAMHRLYHASALLWRFHRVHHSDADLGATTSVRFHAGEVLLSAVLRLPVIGLLGSHPWGVVAFEGGLLLASQLQHADVRLPHHVEIWVRRLLVTPDIHTIHHSSRRALADSNYGTVLTLWDRLLGTLRETPAPEQVTVGPPDGGETTDSLHKLLLMPFGARPAPRSTRHRKRPV